MIPVLSGNTPSGRDYPVNLTAQLIETISCHVTEERNGVYELVLQYPIVSRYSDCFLMENIITAEPAPGKTPQMFRIYRTSQNLDGIITVYANHISYDLNYFIIAPFSASGISNALTGILNNAKFKSSGAYSIPFTVWTNKTTAGTFAVTQPKTFREALGGSDGSILDVFGSGEYEFDNYRIRLYAERGSDRGFKIKYGKNMTALTYENDRSTAMQAICPFWKDQTTGTVVTLPPSSTNYIVTNNMVRPQDEPSYAFKRAYVMDCTEYFQTQPTAAELLAFAEDYLEKHVAFSSTTADVSYVDLRGMSSGTMGNETITANIPGTRSGNVITVPGTISGDTLTISGSMLYEFAGDNNPADIYLCDTVTVEHEGYGISYKAKVSRVEYDVLTGRYTSIEVGDPQRKLKILGG